VSFSHAGSMFLMSRIRFLCCLPVSSAISSEVMRCGSDFSILQICFMVILFLISLALLTLRWVFCPYGECRRRSPSGGDSPSWHGRRSRTAGAGSDNLTRFHLSIDYRARSVPPYFQPAKVTEMGRQNASPISFIKYR